MSEVALPLVQIIIFSKDRACQLDSLLRSVRDHLHYAADRLRISILFKASDERFAAGYARCKSAAIMPDLHWVEQQDFVTDLLTLCAQAQSSEDMVLFLVDDDIVFRPVDLMPLIGRFSRRHLFISLRVDCGYLQDVMPQFISTDPVLEWKWNYHKQGPVTWNYPFSLDGSLFHTGHIRRALRGIRFAAPNSLEGMLHRARHRWWIKRVGRALAPLRAAVFNNPLNRVQTEGETWHCNVSAAELNDRYLDGLRIDNRILYEAHPDAIHYAADVRFEPWSGQCTSA